MKRIFSFVVFCFVINISNAVAQCVANYGFVSNNSLTVQFLDSSINPQGSTLTYFWDFGDGTISTQQNPTHTYSSFGTYLTCLTIQDNNTSCLDSACYSIFIPPPSCMASFTYANNPNNAVNFFGNVSGGVAPYTYLWDFGFGPGSSSTLLNPTFTYPSPGSYGVTFTVTDTNGITCSFFDTVLVNNTCVADFSYQFTANGVVSFSNLSTPNGAGINFSWNFGDGTFSNTVNPSHSYSSIGNYAVTLSMFDSSSTCFSQMIDTIYIDSTSNCLAGFSYNVNNDTLFIDNLASGYNSISYNFGDSSSSNLGSPNITHIYAQSGTYLVCQTISNSITNCTNTFCDTIRINITPPCKAEFTHSVNDNIVDIVNKASNYTSISYNFGDGSVINIPNPSYTYAQSGTYTICQTVTNNNTGCSDVFCDTVIIVVPPPCQAGFTYSSSVGTLSIQNTAQNYTSITYDFGDGTTSSQTNPSHTYISSGSYQVCQTVTNNNNCTSTFCDTVFIRIPPPCQAGFNYSITGDTTYFTSSASSFNRVIYYFGDGDSSTAANPIHDYQTSGTYQVTQVVFNDTINCIDSITQSIVVTVSFSCVAKYELALDTNRRGILYLINTSSDDGSHSYLWDFGDGTQSNVRLPNHQYSENIAYKICLTVSDSIQGCISSYCDSVGLDSTGNILKAKGFKVEVIDGSFIGLEEESIFHDISIFPNPFSNLLTVELAKTQKIHYQIIQMNGRVIQEGIFNDRRYNLPLEQIQTGIYLLRLFNEDSSLIKKIIKQ